MASEADEGGFGCGGASSLFEGMTLFDASHLLPLPSSRTPPDSESPPPVPDAGGAVAASAPPAAPAVSLSASQPLDEDLFSDLTILTPMSLPATTASSPASSSETPAGRAAPIPPDLPSPAARSAATPETPPLATPARQMSRKKKRAIKIGYGRGPAEGWLGGSAVSNQAELEPDAETSLPPSLSDSHSHAEHQERLRQDLTIGSSSTSSPSALPSLSPCPVHTTSMESEPVLVVEENLHSSNSLVDEKKHEMAVAEGDRHHTSGEPSKEKDVVDEHQPRSSVSKSETKENGDDTFSSAEGKLDKIRSHISEKLGDIKKTITLLSDERKAVRRRRQEAAESMHAVSVKYKELERELEEACEVEDFERAERVSESLAAAEKDKDNLLRVLRRAEENCDAIDSKMQAVLELQISVEEDGATLLEKISKDAADDAKMVMEGAARIFSEDMKAWNSAIENLERRKLEMCIESDIVDEARARFTKSIEQLTEDDQKEKEMLSIKGSVLAKELDELLALVKQKEEQILENNAQIQKVEERICKVVSEFQETQSAIDAKYNDMQSGLSCVESEGESLFQRKKEIDGSLSFAEQKSMRLRDLAYISLGEVKALHNSVAQRRSLVSYILKAREEKLRLTGMEEKISEEIQLLQQQITSARTYLQDLSSSRASIQESITSLKQRINFMDKRGPELEAEKKAVAAARNFKEARRIADEAKALTLEKESVQHEYQTAIADSEKMEDDVKKVTAEILEKEELILSKERDAAIARSERLFLVATAAKAEQLAVLESCDAEESSLLLAEAEVAESESKGLQQKYDFELDKVATVPEFLLSIPIITNLSNESESFADLPLTGGSYGDGIK